MVINTIENTQNFSTNYTRKLATFIFKDMCSEIPKELSCSTQLKGFTNHVN